MTVLGRSLGGSSGCCGTGLGGLRSSVAAAENDSANDETDADGDSNDEDVEKGDSTSGGGSSSIKQLAHGLLSFLGISDTFVVIVAGILLVLLLGAHSSESFSLLSHNLEDGE